MNEYLKRCIELAVEINDILGEGHSGINVSVNSIGMVTFSEYQNEEEYLYWYSYKFNGNHFYNHEIKVKKVEELLVYLERKLKTIKGDK